MERFGESEVEDLHLAGWLDHDVRAFQIAVDDAALVGARDAGGNLARAPLQLPQAGPVTNAAPEVANVTLPDDQIGSFIPRAAPPVWRKMIPVAGRRRAASAF